MNQRWLLIGLMSLSLALVEGSWREHLLLSPLEPTLNGLQAATEQGRSTTQPRLDTLTFGCDVIVETTLYDALLAAGVPARFATKLEMLLGEFMAAPLEFSDSERIQLLWE